MRFEGHDPGRLLTACLLLSAPCWLCCPRLTHPPPHPIPLHTLHAAHFLRCNQPGVNQEEVWRDIAAVLREALLQLEERAPPNPNQVCWPQQHAPPCL